MLDDIMGDNDGEVVRESIIKVGANPQHEELKQRFSASIENNFVAWTPNTAAVLTTVKEEDEANQNGLELSSEDEDEFQVQMFKRMSINKDKSILAHSILNPQSHDSALQSMFSNDTVEFENISMSELKKSDKSDKSDKEDQNEKEEQVD